jgi:broad-specificity NMP kinase
MKIPKTIKTNSALLIIFRFCQKKVKENIYSEIAGLMTYDKFEQLYDIVTEENHAFFTIDNTQPVKENRLKKNFEYVIKF